MNSQIEAKNRLVKVQRKRLDDLSSSDEEMKHHRKHSPSVSNSYSTSANGDKPKYRSSTDLGGQKRV